MPSTYMRHARARRSTRRRFRIAAAAASVALVSASLLVTGAPAAEAAGATTFTTRGEHAYVVPDGVAAVRIEVVGGHGGKGSGDNGGAGGRGGDVVAVYSVTPGDTLYAEVGADGGDLLTGVPTSAGGGATAAAFGGNGGEASSVQLCPVDACTDSRIVIAGGGGGGGGEGQPGEGLDAAPGGAGGDAGSAGANGGGSSLFLVASRGGKSGGQSNPGGAGGFPNGSGDICTEGVAGGGGGTGTALEGTDGGSVGRGLGGDAYGGGGGGGAGGSGGGGGGGGGNGASGGGGGGGGGIEWCSEFSPIGGGGAGGGGGTNLVTGGARLISSGVATTASMVSITPLPNQTITFDTTPPADPTVHGSYVPAATASSGLPVVLTVDDSSTACESLPADPGTVVFVAAGICTIDADQPGDADWAPAPRVVQSFLVTDPRMPQEIFFTSTAPAGAVTGGTYTPTAEATSGLPVELTIDAGSTGVCGIAGGVVTFTSAGTCTIDADQPGDGDWKPAEQVHQAIDIASARITSDDHATFTIGKSGAFTVTTAGDPAPALSLDGDLPDGVTFVDGGDGTAQLSGIPEAGTAGEYPLTVRATAGDGGGATQAFTLTVVRLPSDVELHAAGTAALGDPVTIGVDVLGGDPPSGTVEFSVDGESLGSATLDGTGHAEFTTSALTIGRKVVTAAYGGDATFAPSTATVTIVVSGGTDPLAMTGSGLGGVPFAALVLVLAGGAMLLIVARRRRRRRDGEVSP
jgi:hypothetical protein